MFPRLCPTFKGRRGFCFRELRAGFDPVRPGQRTDTIAISTDTARLDVSLHDAVKQQVHAQHILIDEKGVRLYPVQLRYVWPSELDLMARLVKLELQNRFGGWRGEPFSNVSVRHISVYRHAGSPKDRCK